MDLAEIYEKYKGINKQYSEFIESLVSSNFKEKDEEEILGELNNYNTNIQCLKVDVDLVEGEDGDNLKDLNYLIVDLIFLSVDLLNFYRYKEIERFKMRATNYLNKQRRSELFS